LDVAVDRILSARSKLKYYEAGMDLGLSENKVTSFRLFQQRIITEYDKMVDEMGLTVIDGTLPVEKQQKLVRQVVKKTLQGWDGLRSPFLQPRHTTRKHIIAPVEVQEGN
jgi:dTMP kinase